MEFKGIYRDVEFKVKFAHFIDFAQGNLTNFGYVANIKNIRPSE